MQSFVIKALGVIFLVYIVMALFISLRDIFTTKHKILWIPVVTIIITVVLLLFASSWLPALALPIVLLISGPIFVTDKRRNWDIVDQIFRWVSLVAVIGAAYLTFNAFFFR